MRYTLLSLLCVLAATQAEPQYANQYYPVANQYYPTYDPYAFQPPVYGQQNRLFWNQIASQIITTTTTTSTSTTTCTVYTVTGCRRKRFLADELRGEDDADSESPVNK